MIKKLVVGLLIGISTFKAYANQPVVYPVNWWVGMKTNKLQLLFKSTDTTFSKGTISTKYPGVSVLGSQTFENGKYLAVDIEIESHTQPGNVDFIYSRDNAQSHISWLLKTRKSIPGKDFAQGISTADLVYLILPDRFSNGDTTNDRVSGMRDQSLNRADYYARHGGDFKGVIKHLDYLQDLGVSALWMTPVMENDMPNRTEHGYAITNHYKIDARYGGNDGYRALSDSLHRRNMKLVQDAVYNHTGTWHVLVQDLPAKDWLNQWPEYTSTSAREQALFDPYASQIDKKRMSSGWFVKEMPDWNQRNANVANFIIENAIWYIEEFGVDAIRLDTYMYNDLEFGNKCNAAIMNEYPQISLFGEMMVQQTPNQAFFVQNNINNAFTSNLPGAVDFVTLFNGLIPSLTQEQGWGTGIIHLYNVLSQDFLYKDPTRNVVLLDNHDLNRFFSVVKGDLAKQKIAYTWLLTTRGIPQLYYGSEVLMAGEIKPDGLVRLDFPGGWNNDSKNAFTGKGMSADEVAMQQLVKKLGTYRKNSSALKSGKLMQFTPKDGLYVYFRYNDQQTIMCVLNASDKPRKLDFSYFNERTNGFSRAKNIIEGTDIRFNDATEIPAHQEWVLELYK
ncbi:alpha-amylase [Chitinophaga silvatica]|uniref:Alpha-amylase n=1 Tax=Chitinophaga silvatica TaxID=2282649 RepID=A0A3E1Y7J0_9BACT|nr:alpha-amylase family glycosyl hydrolase [Chitinophaga silvatica]RFS21050.1 alpha-amylase [Chitinophaga silvatica]